MATQTKTTKATPDVEAAVLTIRNNFEATCNRLTKWLEATPDNALLQKVAPNRNSALYLVAHLVAVNDTMLTLFGLGDRKAAELDAAFVQAPDGAVAHTYMPQQVKELWKQHTASLLNKLSSLTTDDWLQRHTVVSEEDFRQQPHRTKLNVLLGRTNHLSYHLGQLVLIKGQD